MFIFVKRQNKEREDCYVQLFLLLSYISTLTQYLLELP